MSKNVLIIGTYHPEGVDSFSWSQELPYLPDYDTIILDTAKLYTSWALGGRLKPWKEHEYLLSNVFQDDERLRSNMTLVRNKLLEMLEFGVTVYALYGPQIVINYELGPEYSMSGSDKAYAWFITTNEWCPISIDTAIEKGKRILVKDKSYEEYFRNFTGWEYYFVPGSLEIGDLEAFYQDKWKVSPRLIPIAENSLNQPIAVRFTLVFHAWDEKAMSLPPNERGWKWKPSKIGGDLVLLPVADQYHTELLIETLLQRGKVFEETPRPTWVDKIEILGEASIKAEIAKESKKLAEQAHKVKELEASLTELRKHKRLLYSTGLELQDMCRSTLDKIGAKTRPSDVTDEFMIEVGGKEALVEVKGNTRSITKDDLSQLIADLAQQIKVTDSPTIIKGILIGNAWRQEPLDERATKDVFTRHVVQYAEAQNIGLLATVELFNAYCKFLEQPEFGSEILDKLINSKGIIKF